MHLHLTSTTRVIAGAIVVMAMLAVAAWAQDAAEDMESLYQFLAGKYEIIGRQPDSNVTYTGSGVLNANKHGLEVLRTLNGKTLKGTGRIEFATPDKIKVLRIRFEDGSQKYEGTFMIGSDLDNYARLTGCLYLQTGKTQRLGLEAWFIGQSALRPD